MTAFRFAFSVLIVCALAAGYFASQYFWFSGEPQRWAQTADTPPFVWLSLLVFLGAIGLAFVKEKS